MKRLLLVSAVCAAACTNDARPRPAEDATPSDSSVVHVDSLPPVSTGWPDALGGLFALANARTGAALTFRRDTLAPTPAVVVVGYDSAATPVSVRDLRPLPCAARALLRVEGAPAGWQLALEAGMAQPVAVETIDDLSPADSQRLMIRVQRLVNTLPDTGSALEFRGLPVVVRDAWMLTGSDGPIVAARVARLRNLEATAHEEQRFVIIERDAVRFVARVAGDEESVESWDLLAALQSRDALWVAIAREGDKSLQLEWIARTGAGWTAVWASDSRVCTPRSR